jgi:plastocyanin
VAWSAGLQLAIPNTPHTLSLQATNTNTATLQGGSRGGSLRRYGFEFTIPITLARYFGRHPKSPAPAEVVPVGPGGIVNTGMANLAYQAPSMTVKVGTTIEWKNGDQVPHTVTADDNSFDSGLIDGGGTWRHTFNTPGTYTYHCIPHPFMVGTVVVQ